MNHHEIEPEILQGYLTAESNRIFIRCGLVATALGFSTSTFMLVMLPFTPENYYVTPCIWGFFCSIYSILLYLFARKAMLRDRFQYLIMIPFVSLPALLYVFAYYTQPLKSGAYITGPPSYLYFLLIFMTGFLFNPRLSILSGILAATQYLFFYFVSYEELRALVISDPFFYWDVTYHATYIIKAMMMLFSGILTGLLSRNIKKLIIKIFNSENQRAVTEAVNERIMESLRYASMIQSSLLSNVTEIHSYLPNSFFIWQPRDIVGGDIFFSTRVKNGFLLSVIDCTGHGVPGAFMTMIACSGLRRIVNDEGYHNPAEILKRLNYFVKTTLQQDTDTVVSDDGLDAAICFVTDHTEDSSQKLVFSGAGLPLFIVKDGDAKRIKGDRQSIGYKRSKLDFPYTNHDIEVEPGMAFYLATDGYIDQLGGETERTFGFRRFKSLLTTIYQKPVNEQKTILIQTLEQFKGEWDRCDDVTVVGFTL